MTWAAVCRYNQARSIISGAALRKYAPEMTTVTYGIEATRGGPVPSTIADIATDWSLPSFDRISQPVDHKFLREYCPSVLAADDMVAESLGAEHPNLKVTSLSHFADDPKLMPKDPLGVPPRELRIELAKVLLLTIRWIDDELHQTPSISSHGVFSADTQWWRECSDLQDQESIVIDTNFSLPESRAWYDKREQITFNPRDLSTLNQRDLNRANLLLRSGFEIDQAPRLFTSVTWRKFLHDLAVMRNVVLVADFPHENPRSPEIRFISLLHSTRTSVW